MSYRELDNKALWRLNAEAFEAGDPVVIGGTAAELLRRTDRSPERRQQANREQAERRDWERLNSRSLNGGVS